MINTIHSLLKYHFTIISVQHFKRFYAYFKACKDTFTTCRPITRFDGCFLKGRYGRGLLMTMEREGNE